MSSNRSNDMSSNHTSSNRSDDMSSATMSSNHAPPPPKRKVGRPRGRPRKYSDCDGIKGNEYRREKDKRDRREKGIQGKKKYPHLDHIKDFKEYRKERDKEDRRLAKEHTDMSELQRQHLEHIEDRNDKEDRQIAKERADISALQRQQGGTYSIPKDDNPISNGYCFIYPKKYHGREAKTTLTRRR